MTGVQVGKVTVGAASLIPDSYSERVYEKFECSWAIVVGIWFGDSDFRYIGNISIHVI